MAQQLNGVLKDFLNMRKSLHKEEKAAAAPAAPAKKIGKKGATAMAVSEELTGNTLARIIEEKPSKKEVSDYFQKMADRLTAEKMK